MPAPRGLVPLVSSLLLLAATAAGVAPPSGAQTLAFDALELPAVETTAGAFRFLRPVALNNRGQVAGTALGGASGGGFHHWVAFLYEPGKGCRALDPRDSLQSNAVFLNESGRVLGYSCCGQEQRYRFFLSTRSTRFNRLNKGWDGWIRNDFHPTALTDTGDIAGFSSKFDDPQRYRRLPVLNRRGQGWIDLSARDERLEQLTSVELEVLRLSRSGDFVMPTTSYGVLGSFGGGELIEISPPDLENTVGALSDAGVVVGEIHTPSRKYEPAGPARAYVFTATGGRVEIHGGRFLESRAVWIAADGTVGGYATKKRPWQPNDRLFTWTRSRGLAVTGLRRALHRLNPRLRFGTARVIDMNDSLQFIGEIWTRKQGEGPREPFNGKLVHFLIDPRAGLVDLQRVLDDAGLDMEIFWLVDLNDHGQILVEARRRSDASRSGIVLTPRARAHTQSPPAELRAGSSATGRARRCAGVASDAERDSGLRGRSHP